MINRLKNTIYYEPIMAYNRLMNTYNWQQKDWPHFRYDLSGMTDILLSIAEKMGLMSGKFSHLSETLQTEALIDLMVEEAIKTSKIEGESLHATDVRSSIKNKLGLNEKNLQVHDKRAQGIADLMLDVRKTFNEPLTEEKLCEWHLMLLAATANANIKVGTWRTDEAAMQIISGYHEKQIVHYEAPPAKDVSKEMRRFIQWFNDTAPGKSHAIKFVPVRSAIAHLYFESIHPFDDGNGRIGRAIAEKALSQGLGYPAMLSLSHAIDGDKKAYYAALKTASRSNEITAWIKYFLNVILTAQNAVELQINFILKKFLFFRKFENQLNERELKVIKRMMQAGIKGYEGGMSAKKYMAMTNVSKATATRDLQHLYEIHALKQIGGGRSIRYELNLD